MAESSKKVNIFISGTSETEEERSDFLVVARNLSKTFEVLKNLQINVIKWPDDFTPGVNDYPQKEIKRQLKDKYDIYIGLLGSKFGSPTPNAGSGTEEEFNDAISRFRQDTTSTRILFYFKQSTENVLKVDPVQLERVQNFQENLTSLGVLYKEFKDKSNFLEIVFDDILKLIANEWIEDKWELIELEQPEMGQINETITNKIDEDKEEIINPEIKNIAKIEEEDDFEDGKEIFILDSLKELNESNEKMLNTTDHISQYTEELGDKILLHTNELNIILSKIATTSHMGGSRQNQKAVIIASELVDKIAEELENYAKNLNPYVTNFEAEINTFLESYSKVYKYQLSQPHEQNEELESAFDSLESMLRSMIETKNSMIDLQKGIEGIAALTRRFKRARNRSSTTVSQLVDGLGIAINKGQLILSELDNHSS